MGRSSCFSYWMTSTAYIPLLVWRAFASQMQNVHVSWEFFLCRCSVVVAMCLSVHCSSNKHTFTVSTISSKTRKAQPRPRFFSSSKVILKLTFCACILRFFAQLKPNQQCLKLSDQPLTVNSFDLNLSTCNYFITFETCRILNSCWPVWSWTCLLRWSVWL